MFKFLFKQSFFYKKSFGTILYRHLQMRVEPSVSNVNNSLGRREFIITYKEPLFLWSYGVYILSTIKILRKVIAQHIILQIMLNTHHYFNENLVNLIYFVIRTCMLCKLKMFRRPICFVIFFS